MAAKKTASSQNNGTQTITKNEAVKRVLAKHGKDTMPLEICKLVKEQFGMKLTPGHASNVKTTLAKKAAGKKKSKKRSGRKVKAAPKAIAKSANGRNQREFSLQDLATVKDLTNRLGAKNLRSLIDLVG